MSVMSDTAPAHVKRPISALHGRRLKGIRAELAERYVRNGEWLNTTLGEMTRELAASDPDLVVIVDGDHEVSLGALFEEASRLASALKRRGLGAGDVISYQLPNWYEASVLNIAASLAGVAVNPLVPIYRDKEVTFMLDDVESRMVFVPEHFRKHDYAEMMERVNANLPNPVEIVVLRGSGKIGTRYEDLLADGDPAHELPEVDPDTPFVLMHTSGTTGHPKCVVHSHNTMLVQGRNNVLDQYSGERDILLVGTPVSHIAGIIIANFTIAFTKAKIILMDIWNPDEAVKMIERHGATVCGGATPFLAGILSSAQAAGTRLPSLRRFGCGGAGIPEELMERAQAYFPHAHIYRIYGSTETPTVTGMVEDRNDHFHSAHMDGQVKYCELKFVDPVTGETVPEGEEGEILIRGANTMLGYLWEEDNEAAFDEEGYFRSGDLGRLVDGDFLSITGRKKDLIIRHGENLSPKEIEDAMFTHPAIENVAVVGMPSAKTGEAVCAFVVLRKGANLDLAEVSRHVTAEGLAKQKIPERLEIVESLPMSVQGKVLKNELREIAAKFA